MEIAERHIPVKKTVLPYYLTAAACLVIISLMVLFTVKDFDGHFFQPHLLAITHLTVFGWGTMVILGASNQLMPVIADKKLYSERLPVAVFLFLVAGTCLLVHSFWSFELTWPIFVGAFSILTSLVLHSINIFVTVKRSSVKNIIIDFIMTAHLWLIVTALIGITLLFNFRFGFLPVDHLHYLKVHASIGMAGWFLLLIIGVSSRLVPMFLLSRKEVKIFLTIAYYLINAGLIFFLIEGMVLRSNNGYRWYISLIVAGILCYLFYIRQCYKSAIRKKIDSGMKVTFVAIGSICLPGIIMIAYLLHSRGAPVSMITAYGYSFFGGFITTLIMGQTFKTLPFIIWIHLTKPDRLQELQPKDLYNEHLVMLQLGLYLPGFLLFLSGILIHSPYLMYPGCVMMIVASVIYCAHSVHVVFHLKNERYKNY
ncbi:MAG: hypothetical protein JST50_14040 [Bacteroidetes bacterium]|jgi:hypothetical protein|nr:hypothetical protein [Bacteroidota bacterium]